MVRFFIKLSAIIYLLFLVSCYPSVDKEVHFEDKEMIAAFMQHEDLLKKLILMIQKDEGIRKVHINYTVPGNLQDIGVGIKRHQKYVELLNSAKLESVFRYDNAYYFVLTSIGMLDSGSTKGFGYLKNRPARIYENLDEMLTFQDNDKYKYRHISDNWYFK